MKASRRRSAFSLIELVVVLMIVGIVAATAIPRFAGAAARQRADAVARRVAADLNLARRHAHQTSASLTVAFDVATDSYKMPGLPDPDRPAVDYEVRLRDEPYQARLVSVNLSGLEKVEFDAYGLPKSGGTIVVAVSDEKRTVNLDPDTGEAYLP